MSTVTWTHKGHAWSDPDAFAPTAPGLTDVAFFAAAAAMAPAETIGGSASIGELVLTLAERAAFTGTITLANALSMVVDHGAFARFTPGSTLDAQGTIVVGGVKHGMLLVRNSVVGETPVVNTAAELVIGQGVGSVGTATVAGASLSVGSLVVGAKGNGSLLVEDEASAVSKLSIDTDLDIGQSAGSSGAVTFSADVSVGHSIVVGGNGAGALSLAGNAYIDVGEGSGTLHVGQGVTGSGTLTIGDSASLGAGVAQIGVEGAGHLVLSDQAILDANTIEVGASGSIQLAGQFTDVLGTLQIDAGGSVSGDGTLVDLTNNGIVTAVGHGRLDIFAPVYGTGTIAIAAHGTVFLGGYSVAASQTIAFIGPDAALHVNPGVQVAGTITGFDGSDQIEVTKATGLAYDAAKELLTVTVDVGSPQSFRFTGLSSDASFYVSEMTNDISDIQLVAPSHS